MKQNIIIIALLIFCVFGAFADFGAIISGEFATTYDGETQVGGNTIFAPWLSMPIGNIDFYLSAGINADYRIKTVIPEIFRLEFLFNPFSFLSARAGRIYWADPTGFTATGRFDGVDAIYDMGSFRLGAALLYTGLLYKDTANINVSPKDTKDYSENFSWKNFGKTYFAPGRILTSFYGDFPGLPYKRGDINAGLLFQFDVSGADERFHTQYLLLHYTYYYKRFDLGASGAMGIEKTEARGVMWEFAYALEGGWQAGLLNDRLSFGLRWASGEGSRTSAFFPITAGAQGVAFKPLFSGIMVMRGKYEARIFPSLAAHLGARYFVRTDDVSFRDTNLVNDSYLLGLELDAKALWVPLSDISFSLNYGVFFPKAGKAYNNEEPVHWSLSLGAIFSF